MSTIEGQAGAAAADEPSVGVLGTIGATPLVELTRLDPSSPFRSYAKLEAHNPGGSIKDRSALQMLRERIRDGRLVPGRSVVVESSSGNLGIGLAQVCGYFGIRFICVADPRTNRQNLAIMRALGAEVQVVEETDPATGEYLPVRIRRVHELLPGSSTPTGRTSTPTPSTRRPITPPCARSSKASRAGSTTFSVRPVRAAHCAAAWSTCVPTNCR